MAQDDMFGATDYTTQGGNALAPLAAQVITMLCERQTVTSAGVRQIALDYLTRAILTRDGFDVGRVLDELRGYRLTMDAVIDLYIPQAAARLGEMWMGSDIDFAEVTVGALRLQSLLGEASTGLVPIGRVMSDVLHALVVVPAGEQHFLGACVAAAQLRRQGCEVSLSICEEPRQIVARAVSDQPDMVLLSCARPAAVAAIVKIVRKIRASSDHAPVIALGGPLRRNADGLRDITGVDLVTNVATDVVGFCIKRKKALGRT